MNTKNLLKFAVVMLVSVSMVFMSCTKDDDPAPTPVAYVPSFSATYISYPAGGVDWLSFAITCVSDDWELIKCDIIYPGGLGNDMIPGAGLLVLRGQPFGFTSDYLKMGGTWTFTITGTIKSGTHVGESFAANTTLNISGK